MQIYLEGLHRGKEEGEGKSVHIVFFARNLMVYVCSCMYAQSYIRPDQKVLYSL